MSDSAPTDSAPPDPDLARMDPKARRFLAMVALGAGAAEAASAGARRRSFEQLMRLSKPPAVAVDTRDLTIGGCGGPIPLRIYTPAPGRTTMAGLIYFHGGGLVAGSLDTHDGLCRTLAEATSCRIVSVGYRLAPEHPFPAAILDALATARGIARHAADFGLDPGAIAIGGDSGGATLAAVTAQLLRRRKLFRAQVLLCPVLDATAAFPSRRTFGAGFLLDADTMARDLAHYAPKRPLGDPYLSPLRANILDGLPTTLIHTAGFDPLRDEGAAYAARLAAAGVDVRLTCHDALIHHFYCLADMIPAARAALAEIAADVRQALA